MTSQLEVTTIVQVWRGLILAGGLEHFIFVFTYIGNNHPIWLIFFRGVGIPPTSLCFFVPIVAIVQVWRSLNSELVFFVLFPFPVTARQCSEHARYRQQNWWYTTIYMIMWRPWVVYYYCFLQALVLVIETYKLFRSVEIWNNYHRLKKMLIIIIYDIWYMIYIYIQTYCIHIYTCICFLGQKHGSTMKNVVQWDSSYTNCHVFSITTIMCLTQKKRDIGV